MLQLEGLRFWSQGNGCVVKVGPIYGDLPRMPPVKHSTP